MIYTVSFFPISLTNVAKLFLMFFFAFMASNLKLEEGEKCLTKKFCAFHFFMSIQKN